MSSIKFYCPIHKLMFVCESSCCEPLPLSEGSPKDGNRAEQTLSFMTHYRQRGVTFNASTITIGTKWLGSKSSDQQYKIFSRDIRSHMKRYNLSKDKYFYYTFELQENGQLHAHGIEINTYVQPFHEMFASYGKRNLHKDSFEPVKNLPKYFEYVNKTCKYPTITNITLKVLARHKRDIKANALISHDPPMTGDGRGLDLRAKPEA